MNKIVKMAAHSGRNISLVLILIFGFVVSVAMAVLIQRWVDSRNETARIGDATHSMAVVGEILHRTRAEVHATGALFRASEFVSRDEFRRFVDSVMAEEGRFHALVWAPMVRAEERAEFETAARSEGFPGFAVQDLSEERKFVPAEARDNYFPALYVEPLGDREMALGYDLGSSDVIRAALEAARDAGTLHLTSRVPLIGPSEGLAGFLMIEPVYEQAVLPETVEARRAELQGFVVGVIEIESFVAVMTESMPPRLHRFDLFIFDEGAPADNRVLYPLETSVRTRADLGAHKCHSFRMELGERSWVVSHCLEAKKGLLARYWQASSVLVMGMLATLLGYVYLKSVRSYARQTERLSNELASLIDGAYAPIFGVNRYKRVTEWNRAMAILTGYGKDEVLHCNLIDEFIDGKNKQSVNYVFDQALDGRETENYKMHLVTKKGGAATLIVNASAHRAPDGTVDGVIGVGQDITRQRLAERALIESEARYRDIVDNAELLIVTFVPESGRILFTNKTWCEKIGTHEEDMEAIEVDEVIHASSVSDWRRAVARVGKGQEVQEVKTILVPRNGPAVEVEGSLIRRIDADGHTTVHGVFVDVTERREARAQMVQAAKLATLGEMATGVAHELNQPLNVIRLASGNILRKLARGNADMEYLKGKIQRISEQTERAGAIIDHMRIFGRKADEKPATLDLRQSVRSVLDLIGEQIRLSDIRISIDLPEECPRVDGHRVTIEQVLLNIIGNARDAIKSNSEKGKGEIRIGVEDRENQAVKIVIEDTGGGIPEDVIDRIFNPFFTTKEPGKGTGLGLSVSYGIIRDMGGSIRAENIEGGARFEIELPAAKEEVAEKDEERQTA